VKIHSVGWLLWRSTHLGGFCEDPRSWVAFVKITQLGGFCEGHDVGSFCEGHDVGSFCEVHDVGRRL
jgi:hypothetical protein